MMHNTLDNTLELQAGISTATTTPKHRRTFTRVLVAGFLLIDLVALLGLGWYLAVTQLTIHPETATRTQLVRWFVIRDFAAESIAVQDLLADRFESDFGMSSGKMPQFKFSETTQQMIRSVTGKHAGNTGSKTRSDHNTAILIRRLIERSRRAYTSAPRDNRNVIVQHTAAQLAWWEQLQVAYCNAIGVVPPTQTELMKEIEQRFRDIIADAPEAEHAAIKQYRTILIAALVLQQIKRHAPNTQQKSRAAIIGTGRFIVASGSSTLIFCSTCLRITSGHSNAFYVFTVAG